MGLHIEDAVARQSELKFTEFPRARRLARSSEHYGHSNERYGLSVFDTVECLARPSPLRTWATLGNLLRDLEFFLRLSLKFLFLIPHEVRDHSMTFGLFKDTFAILKPGFLPFIQLRILLRDLWELLVCCVEEGLFHVILWSNLKRLSKWWS